MKKLEITLDDFLIENQDSSVILLHKDYTESTLKGSIIVDNKVISFREFLSYLKDITNPFPSKDLHYPKVDIYNHTINLLLSTYGLYPKAFSELEKIILFSKLDAEFYENLLTLKLGFTGNRWVVFSIVSCPDIESWKLNFRFTFDGLNISSSNYVVIGGIDFPIYTNLNYTFLGNELTNTYSKYLLLFLENNRDKFIEVGKKEVYQNNTLAAAFCQC